MKRKTIALTGLIGSGKSTVGQYLKSKGYSVIDCDSIAREIASMPETVSEVGALLGDIFIAGGVIDRRAVRECVFSSPELLKSYNDIFFSRIKRALCDKLNLETRTVFVEIPILDAFEFDWNEIWLVKSDKDLTSKRVSERDGVSVLSAKQVTDAQKEASHYTLALNNSNGKENLYAQIDALLEQKALD